MSMHSKLLPMNDINQQLILLFSTDNINFLFNIDNGQ